MKKKNIVKKNYDFERIIKTNSPYIYKDYIVYVEYEGKNEYCFGISVSKKIGNAVTRNYTKRRIKNAIDKNHYQNNFNCIIIVRKGILERSFQQIDTDLKNIFLRLNILQGENNEKK